MSEREQVTTLERIAQLAKERRALISRNGNTRLPAAVFMQMSGVTILKFINFGLYVYEKGEKQNGNNSD